MTDATTELMDLSGVWTLELDPEDRGLREGWQRRAMAKPVSLPGSLTEQNLGDEVTALKTPWMGDIKYEHAFFTSEAFAPYRRRDNLKIPYWLTPVKYFAGAAWYQRHVHVPPGWSGRRHVLHLERPHWETRVFVDGNYVGRCESLATPHEYDLTDHLVPGNTHTITIRVDNRMIVNVGPNSHSVSDHTQGNWNGIVGRIELRSGSRTWLDGVSLKWSAAGRTLHVSGEVGNTSGLAGSGAVRLAVNSAALGDTPVAWSVRGGRFDATLKLPEDAALWDEFTPVVHRLGVSLVSAEGKTLDARELPFGLRDLGRDGRRLTINGRRAYLRGTLECCVFPLTGYPPTEVRPWRRIMKVAKDHGLNHLRFHSYCPPEAAFVAADEAGVYLQVECSSWPNQGATVGDGSATDQFLFDEGRRIVREYGHHPSFCMLASGNEPGGEKQNAFLTAWTTYWRQEDPMRLHTTGAGWPVLPGSDFHSAHAPRLHQWGDGLRSRLNAKAPETVSDYREYVAGHDRPVVSHEIGQWCVYPNLDEIEKYTGVFRSRNYEIVRERLAAKGMAELAKPFLIASGKLQAACYKEEVEAALRTPEFGGFQLLGLTDFPGQGTATVGVLDAFWDEKGYSTAAEFRRFCDSTVVLARLAARTFESGARIEAGIEVAHFGAAPIRKASIEWKLSGADGVAVASGRLGPVDIAVGNGVYLGTIAIDTASLTAPAKYTLSARISGTGHQNSWDVWLYPASVPETAGPVVTRDLGEAMAACHAGKSVLWCPAAASVAVDSVLGFTPVFWNTCWTDNQAPHTLGLLCDPAHAALARFPTEPHTDWQWWELLRETPAMNLDRLGPAGATPIVRAIDDWNEVRSLAVVFETRVGKGKLLVSASDLVTDLKDRPVARQMRHSLISYLASPHCKPAGELGEAELRKLLK